jgi:pimeloyl-ACP methyl ester carboxylesterase
MPIEVHELRIPTTGPEGQQWEIAATVFVPAPLALASGSNILVLLPGAGYGRGYFNLPVPGGSQAMYHAGRGNIVVAIDPLGVGDSSSADDASAAAASAALNAAMDHIDVGLRAGTLLEGVGPVAFGAVVGAGQSLGGHLLVATQAEYETFAGIALLGSSMAGTRFPLPGGGSTDSPAEADFRHVFHWGEIPVVDPAGTPTDLAGLVGVDAAIGLPVRAGDAPWASRSIPGYVAELTQGSKARAGAITGFVLVAAGERDVTAPLAEEAAVFTSAKGVGTYLLPEAAHMHNFADTRELLWKQVDTFVHHSTTYGRRTQSDEYMGRFSATEAEAAEA